MKSSCPEGVKHSDSQPFNIRDISSYQGKTVDHGGGGQQFVDHGDRANGGHLTPRIRILSIHAQDSAREPFDNPLQPCFQRFCLVNVVVLVGKLARLDPRAQLPRNRYNSLFVSASELEGEKGIRVAPVANPILR